MADGNKSRQDSLARHNFATATVVASKNKLFVSDFQQPVYHTMSIVNKKIDLAKTQFAIYRGQLNAVAPTVDKRQHTAAAKGDSDSDSIIKPFHHLLDDEAIGIVRQYQPLGIHIDASKIVLRLNLAASASGRQAR